MASVVPIETEPLFLTESVDRSNIGAELIELLYKHPQSTIPTILKRLKQKGLEWIRIRESFVKKHKEQVARISFCTMDYSACNFRQDDRVKIMPRCLVQDIFALNHSQIEVSRLGDVSGTRRPAMMQKVTGGPDDANAENTALPKMVLKLGRPCIHNNLFHLIYTAIERSSMSEHNKFLVAKFWHHFFAHFLNLPKEVTMTVPNDPRTQTHVKDVHASAGSNNVELNSELATHDPFNVCAQMIPVNQLTCLNISRKTEYHKRADVKMVSKNRSKLVTLKCLGFGCHYIQWAYCKIWVLSSERGCQFHHI